MLKVSIITVTYNNRDVIEDCIRSVLSQSYPAVEYIIVDGGSSDGSLQVINAYRDRITTIISEPDKGIYDAMNKGITSATGDVIGYLNADDFYAHNDVISNIVALFNKKAPDAVYADIDYVARHNPSRIIRKWRSGKFNQNKFYYGWMPPHPTFFVKKSVYEKHGGYNLQQHLAADYELMLRFLFRYHISCSYLPEVIVKMRVGGTSNKNIRNRIRQNTENRRAWVMNNIRPRWYTLILKPLTKIWQYF